MTDQLTVLGQDRPGPDRHGMETFAVPESVTEITLASTELCAVCPVTGQPDIYQVSVTYASVGRALETKTFKRYLWSWRDQPIFAEHLAATIAGDVAAVVGAAVAVVLEQNVRGGITTTVTAEVTA